jgi:hypothetical protein
VFNYADPKSFWLACTNLGLILVILTCGIAIVRVLANKLRSRSSRRAEPGIAFDSHTFLDPSVGITMADGGEKIIPHIK